MNAEQHTQGAPQDSCGSAVDPIEPFLNALAALLAQPGMGPQRSRTTPESPAAAFTGLCNGRA